MCAVRGVEPRVRWEDHANLPDPLKNMFTKGRRRVTKNGEVCARVQGGLEDVWDMRLREQVRAKEQTVGNGVPQKED